MTYNEHDSNRATIAGFLATGFVDEGLVVKNSAAPGADDMGRPSPRPVVAIVQEVSRIVNDAIPA